MLGPVVVTGGYGFIGSCVVNYLCSLGEEVIIVDKLTYAADITRVHYDVQAYTCDVGNTDWVSLIRDHKIKTVISTAAETHVDNSIADGSEFMSSNCVAIHHLLASLNAYYDKYGDKIYLLHISTDEVYGDLPLDLPGAYMEKDRLKPNNPYSAAKAAADLLIHAYQHTYQSFDYTILRACNNFGPGQHREKFIPTVVTSVLAEKPIPVYGDGKNSREWLYVEDFAKAIAVVAQRWKSGNLHTGEVFNVSSGYSLSNLELAKRILQLMGKDDPDKYIEFVTDRKGHDRRYSISSSKMFYMLHHNILYTVEQFNALLAQTVKGITDRCVS